MKSECVLTAALFLTFVSSALCAEELKGCKVSSNKKDTTHRRLFDIHDFENNFPKIYEILRIKSFFSWDLPVLGVFEDSYNEMSFYFGTYQNNRSFAIYRGHDDWLNNANPCHVIKETDIFARNDYVEVETFLTKDGIFTVLANGEGGFELQCGLAGSKDFTGSLKMDIGYAGKRNYNTSAHDFFYDCPIEEEKYIFEEESSDI